MKMVKLNDTYFIICEVSNTRNGFKHTATLMHNGAELDSTKICYLNRTWEAYKYESVMLQLLDETTELTDKEKRRFKKKVKF